MNHNQSPAKVKFNELEIGEICWVVIMGQPVEVTKISFQGARKLSGRQGKTFVSPTRWVFDSAEAAAADLADLLARGRQIALAAGAI